MIHLFATLALDTTDVVILGVGLGLDEHAPGRGVGSGDAGRASAPRQHLVARAVPARVALGGRSSHVLGELEVGQVGADADAASVALAVVNAGQGQEGELVDAVGEPVGQLVTGLFAEADYRLLIGHTTFVAIGVAKLVEPDDLVEGLHRLFVAFQRAVARDTVAFEVGQQRDNRACALFGLFQFGDMLDHRIRVLAQERIDEGLVTRLGPEVFGPGGLLLRSERRKVCIQGGMLLTYSHESL